MEADPGVEGTRGRTGDDDCSATELVHPLSMEVAGFQGMGRELGG